jgi:hypothetical protein
LAGYNTGSGSCRAQAVLHVVEYVPVEPMGETLLPAVKSVRIMYIMVNNGYQGLGMKRMPARNALKQWRPLPASAI